MKCDVFGDLLPMYVEGLCSNATVEEMKVHALECDACREKMRRLKAGQDNACREEGWDKQVEPLKKVRTRMKRKTILLILLGGILTCMLIVTGILTWGQLFHKGVSFETVYDGMRFERIGREFAKGNLEPLYQELWDPYFEVSDRMLIIQQAYPNAEQYRTEMLGAMEGKWQELFQGKHLKYRGIYSIGYDRENGSEGVLKLSLHFTGDGGMEYYVALQKEGDGKFRIWDFWGKPEATYSRQPSTEDKASTSADRITSTTDEAQTTDNSISKEGGAATNAYATVFACISNYDQDENEIVRQWIRIKGEKALQGDDQLARDGKQCSIILSEAEASGKEDGFSKSVEEYLQSIMEAGYYPTDLATRAVGYDTERKLYLYRMTLEITEKEKGDRVLVTFDCYRQAGYYLFEPGTVCVYGEGIEENVKELLGKLFET